MIHSSNDGRGLRKVYVNGNEIQYVVWADDKRGKVVFLPRPFREHKTRPGEVYRRTLRGHVEVEFE